MTETMIGLFAAAVLSGIVPLVNAEILVISAAALVPALGVPVVAVVSTVGHMSSKALLFGLARWAPQRLPERARAAIERSSAAVRERGTAAGTLIFTSAATGIPPFYGVSLAAGAVGLSLTRFVVVGGLGRFVRFAVLAWLGHTVGTEALDLIASNGVIATLFG
ncbi:MAG: VTT domain-containing protein [Gemmatimonadota bacterium]